MLTGKKVIPRRIRQARISRGYSIAEIAELVGLSKQAISQFELGKNEPGKSNLLSIARELDYPVSFFYKEYPCVENSDSLVFFRSKKTTTVKDKNSAKEKIEIFREIHNYLTEYVDFPDLNLPKIDYPDVHMELDENIIENYAQKLRIHWGLGNGPIQNLTNVAQKNGIMISQMSLRIHKIDAFSVWYDGIPYIFLSADKHSNARIRFDIAHELGHLIMHSDIYSEDDFEKSVIRDKLEREADRFAAAFLLPEITFSKDVVSSSLSDYIPLKNKWLVSLGAMIYRLADLELLSDNQIKYLKDQMTSHMYWRNEPLDKEIPIEKPFACKQAVELLIDNNIINKLQFIDDIGVNADEIEAYCFLDPGTLKDKTPSNIIKLKDVKTRGCI